MFLLTSSLFFSSCSERCGLINPDKHQNVTLILGAFSDEIKPIAAQMEKKSEGSIAGISFTKGKLYAKNVVVTWTGIGKVNAAATTALLIEHFKPDQVIVCGIAGGLNPELKVGDVVIAEKTVQHDLGFWSDAGIDNNGFDNRITGQKNPVFFMADEKLLNLAKAAANQAKVHFKKGIVVTGDTFIMSPKKKIELQNRLNADAVEMEGAAIAQVSHQWGIPFLIIRAISDSADENANVDVDTFQNIAIKNATAVTCKMMELMAVKKSN